MVAARRVSALRAWATKNLVVADGPKAGKRWKPGGRPWEQVLDAMDDRALEQVTIRGSVQSGKTATLIAAGLGHSAAGRSVLFYEPDHTKHHKQTGSLADVIAFQCGRLALPYRAEPAQGVTPELIARACREGYEGVPVGASVLVWALSTCRTPASRRR